MKKVENIEELNENEKKGFRAWFRRNSTMILSICLYTVSLSSLTRIAIDKEEQYRNKIYQNEDAIVALTHDYGYAHDMRENDDATKVRIYNDGVAEICVQPLYIDNENMHCFRGGAEMNSFYVPAGFCLDEDGIAKKVVGMDFLEQLSWCSVLYNRENVESNYYNSVETIAATATTKTLEDGSVVTLYSVPDGFDLQGNQGIKKIHVEEPMTKTLK